MKTKVQTIVNVNKDNAVAAAYLEAGKIANNQLVKLTKSHTPVMARGYVDTPVGKLVLANLLNLAVDHFKPDNQELNQLSQAMICSAYQDVISSVDIEGLLEEFMDSASIKRSLSKLRSSEEVKD